MQQHMDKIYTCVFTLLPFFQSVSVQDWDEADKYNKTICLLEEEADELKKAIRLHMPSGLFLAIARGDLLSLLTLQDKIANKAKHIAGLVVMRKMVIPVAIKESFLKFIQRSVDAAALARKAINELDGLVETGFHGYEVKVVADMVLELDQVERDTDNIQLSIRQQLFALEQTLPPVDVIFLYKIIDWTGELADRAQQVGQRLESFLAD